MQVSTMVEKPHPKLFLITPLSEDNALPAEIFELIEETSGAGGEIQFIDASMLAKHNNVLGFSLEGERYDTGNALGLLRASLLEARGEEPSSRTSSALINEMHSLLSR